MKHTQAIDQARGSQAGLEKRRLGFLCGIAVVGILVCTLWPFNPFPSNDVSWLPEGKGIRFGNHGLVFSKTALQAEGTGAGESCSLELFFKPADVEGSSTILSFYASDNSGQFRIRQWTDGLLVSRDAFDPRAKNAKGQKFDIDHALHAQRPVFLTMTSGPTGTVVYLDGREVRVLPKFAISRSDISGEVIIGTSGVEYQPWAGEIHSLVIYSKYLMPEEVLQHNQNRIASGTASGDPNGAIARYAFAEGSGREIHNAVVSGPNLEMPRRFSVPHKVLLQSPLREFSPKWSYWKDVLQNIAGFIPAGFLFFAYFGLTRNRPNAIICAILAGASLSFMVEVLQAFIPRRNSGVTDIITNTVGAALGAVLARPTMLETVLGTLDWLIRRRRLRVAK